MATEEKEVVVSSSILVQFANKDVDWLSIPPKQRVIDDEMLEWLVGNVLPTDDGSDDFNLAEVKPPSFLNKRCSKLRSEPILMVCDQTRPLTMAFK